MGPSVVVGPRNITFTQCLCKLVTVALLNLTSRPLLITTELSTCVALGSNFTRVPVTTDPFDLEELIRLICLLLVTFTYILCMTGPALTVTPSL